MSSVARYEHHGPYYGGKQATILCSSGRLPRRVLDCIFLRRCKRCIPRTNNPRRVWYGTVPSETSPRSMFQWAALNLRSLCFTRWCGAIYRRRARAHRRRSPTRPFRMFLGRIGQTVYHSGRLEVLVFSKRHRLALMGRVRSSRIIWTCSTS